MSLNLPQISADIGSLTLQNVADGSEAWLVAALSEQLAPGQPLIYVLREGQRSAQLKQQLRFVAPQLPVLELPGWDCLPYDRVSPAGHISARRLQALAALAALRNEPHGAVVLVSVNALMQRLLPFNAVKRSTAVLSPGCQTSMETVIARLQTNGFERVPTVREVGEYAVRGGIIDLFAPGDEEAVRLDFFGNTLETIRAFDVQSQRTTTRRRELVLQPMREVALTPETIEHFRGRYRDLFGAPSREDIVYSAVSEGQWVTGLEHWQPLFYPQMETLFDYCPDAPVIVEHLVQDAIAERDRLIVDYHAARQQNVGTGSSAAYHPAPPNLLYLSPEDINTCFKQRDCVQLDPFDAPQTAQAVRIDAGIATGRDFVPERNDPDANVFDALVRHIANVTAQGSQVLIAGWTKGSLDRLLQILDEHNLQAPKEIGQFDEIRKNPENTVFACVVPLEKGFATKSLTVIAEQDILGDRLVRQARKKRKSSNFIAEAASLSAGDIVVHVDHGIGRFIGLRTIEAAGAPHDCLELHYSGDDRLFLPVENIELLSRYGSENAEPTLDRLGGIAWQARKAKLKKQLLEMAGALINVAAARQMAQAPKITPQTGLYAEFAARFPYEETEEQQAAIDAVVDDLGEGRPMDRLVCGDVGFGKTEVALRAAFVTAMEGHQVAVVVPTTLLARQHFKTFSERFSGLPVKVRQASRLVATKELSETKKGLADGSVDVVVGTHALLGQSIKFDRLGLLIIDEEQHFGVKHKEQLKELKTDVHVLTLTATPIPRTLQLALTGVRELSLITTAPLDRLAVRSFVSPFDPLVIRETLLRERYRGGQSFYVVPRISDLADVEAFLKEQVPELKVAIAHGQMPPGKLDDIMNAFYDGKYHVLLSTTIVESGLDIPSANTLIVHRADMFGLAQLYQLRGRVGRSKARAYALFTLPARATPTKQAMARLKVLQSLDTLGAGFQLASHDLDLRGAGNLLGDAQSGHIREVGFELYQQMLEEAVAELRGQDQAADTGWSPQISVGTAVMIPEAYVPDLHLRLNLYRRLADLTTPEEIDGFCAELIDRFGSMPEEVNHLLKIVFIKGLCRSANVEKLDAGPKGAVLQFRNGEFQDPAALMGWIAKQGELAKVRPDQSVFIARNWTTPMQRLNGAATLMTQICRLLQAKAA